MKLGAVAVFLSYVAFQDVLGMPGRMMSPRASASEEEYQLSKDPDFHYEILRVMSYASAEGADLGEVLVAAQKIKPGDFESFYSAFNTLADRVNEQAKSIDHVKYPISARNTYFRASSYYRWADFYLHGNWTDPRIDSLWVKQLAAFDKAMGLLPIPGQRVTLQAAKDNFTIPAIFFGSGRPGPRPTIILGNGYDGSQEEMYHVVGEAALKRGINVITYEGPGQPTVRRYQDRGFIPDWEQVVTPVVDFALTRPEVDPKSIGLWGYSFGGYLAPRAAAFEHRLAAVLAVDGVFDFGESALRGVTGPLKKLYDSGDQQGFDKIVQEGLASNSMPTSVRWSLEQGMWSFNMASPYEFLKAAQKYNLAGVAKKVKAPVFVGDAQGDDFFPGQAKKLNGTLEAPTYHLFKTSDGAGEHCSVGANALLQQMTLDWFEDVLGQK